jgi:hypothetical protein
MTIEELLTLEQSRRNVDQVISIVKNNPEFFDTLWLIFVSNREPESRRAAWAIDILNEDLSFLTNIHLETLIDLLPEFRHNGLKRHALRILERNVLPRKNKGQLVSICFNLLESNKSPVAVKMFSIKILARVAMQEPDLIRELIEIIEIQMNDSTPGFRSIGGKIIRQLQSRR